MGWLVLGVWIGVLVVAVIVLGFCGYELYWKLRRLRGDIARLDETAEKLRLLQRRAAVIAGEAAQLRSGRTGT